MQNVHEFFKIKLETSKTFRTWLWQVQAVPLDSWGSMFAQHSCCLAYFSGKVWEEWDQRVFAAPSNSSVWAEITHLAKWWSGWQRCRIHQEFSMALIRSCSSLVQPSLCVCAFHSPTDDYVLCQAQATSSWHIDGNLLNVRHTGSHDLKRHRHVNRVRAHSLSDKWVNKSEHYPSEGRSRINDFTLQWQQLCFTNVFQRPLLCMNQWMEGTVEETKTYKVVSALKGLMKMYGCKWP
jgi:hypothetical protein